MRISCPTCHRSMLVSLADVGQKVECGHCGQRIRVPSPSKPAASNPTRLGKLEEEIPPAPHVIPPPPAPLRAIPYAEEMAPKPKPVPYAQVARTPEPTEQGSGRAKASRRARGFVCPFCHTTDPPWRKNRISMSGWAVFFVGLFVCLPLCFVGLFITEDYHVCSECGVKLG